ncbi:hypothetical protein FH972_021892 [Carpinus fangiana]|uniref:Carboxypeptidase n=1 Tax=Carpinus fangiana TaxID=176857 RepID=A0A5N6KQM1_9ROSI|nr:hypothetical protein FH972_021892 [Carpinus fangiana]
MKLLINSVVVSLLAATVTAGGADVYRKAAAVKQRFNDAHGIGHHAALAARATEKHPPSNGPSQYLNAKSKRFRVDGTKIPEVDFDVGESYAGLLPISSDPHETRKLYFWFFPSSNYQAGDEIAIWFNGGPGCSSLSGLLTENGPFLWQAGTLAPTPNPYSFSNLTNYVWVEQPVGVGFSQGKPNITNEIELAAQFKGFWKNFVDTFALKGRKIFITGESYGGFYVPYVANSFLEARDTEYFNLKGIAVNDPIIGDGTLQQELPVVPYIDYWSNIFYLNSTFRKNIQDTNDRCGYTNYTNRYFTFPPPPRPWPETSTLPGSDDPACDVFSTVYEAALEVNPCFNIYHITDTCPHLYGQLGIVNDGDYEPPGGVVYFNRKDVQKAINAPVGTHWYQCTPKDVFIGQGDQSPGPALDGTLTNVIEKTKNVIIGSGALDFLLSTNGTLFALQNMTWGGVQGFQKRPSKPFYVPFHPEYNGGALAGAGTLGVWGAERGLTFYDLQLAGHEVPGYAAGGAYRSIELMLGRVKSLGDKGPFTTLNNATQGIQIQ